MYEPLVIGVSRVTSVRRSHLRNCLDKAVASSGVTSRSSEAVLPYDAKAAMAKKPSVILYQGNVFMTSNVM